MVVGVFYTNNVQVFIMVGALYLFSLGGITFPNYLLGYAITKSRVFCSYAGAYTLSLLTKCTRIFECQLIMFAITTFFSLA